MRLGKVWGVTEPLIVTPLMQLHRITVLPNARCSTHLHRRMWNAFYCISGSASIMVKKAAYDLVDRTELKAGDLTTVQPGEDHWFVSGPEGAVLIEVYYLEPLGDDIVRRDVGRLLTPGVTD